MTFKEIQTALKARSIKKTIQEIAEFMTQNSLDLDANSLDHVVFCFQYAEQDKDKERAKANKESFERSHNLVVLGEFYALTSEDKFYVVFLSKSVMVQLYCCESLEQAKLVADWLNNASKQ